MFEKIFLNAKVCVAIVLIIMFIKIRKTAINNWVARYYHI